jgi:hypothetical protein
MNQYYEFWKSSINQQLSRDPINNGHQMALFHESIKSKELVNL